MATALLPLREQVVKGPDLVLDIETEPVGVYALPALVSVTVTEQLVVVPASKVVGEQLTESDVARCVTVREVAPVAEFTHDWVECV